MFLLFNKYNIFNVIRLTLQLHFSILKNVMFMSEYNTSLQKKGGKNR